VKYEIAGSPTTNIVVDYQAQWSAPIQKIVATSAPGIYTLNTTGLVNQTIQGLFSEHARRCHSQAGGGIDCLVPLGAHAFVAHSQTILLVDILAARNKLRFLKAAAARRGRDDTD
jgi:hypothetical protein